MKSLPYYPMYVDHFDEDPKVLEMSLDEVGLYLLTLNESWKRGSIPDEPSLIGRMIRRDANAVANAWAKVKECWVPSGVPGRLINKRQEIERVKALEKSRVNSINATKRKTNGVPNAQPNAVANATTNAPQRASISISSSVLETTKKENTSTRAKLADSDFDSWFERQYARHPKKKNRVLAEQAAVSHYQSGKLNLEEFEKIHVAWCASEEWKWKGGAKAPTLAEWIEDFGYRYKPESSSDEGDQPPKSADYVDPDLAEQREWARQEKLRKERDEEEEARVAAERAAWTPEQKAKWEADDEARFEALKASNLAAKRAAWLSRF